MWKFRLTSHDENTSEFLGDPVKPPPLLFPMFQWLGPWPLSQGKKCRAI